MAKHEKLCGNVVTSISEKRDSESVDRRSIQRRKIRQYLSSLDRGDTQNKINELTQKYRG